MNTTGTGGIKPIRGAGRTPRVVHAEDLWIEAWAPTREACIAEAVDALVGSFVGRTRPAPSGTVRFEVGGATDAGLLAAVLRAVVACLTDSNVIPVRTNVTVTATGLCVSCETADAAGVLPAGSIPKAVSERGIICAREPGGWRCAARIDV